MFRLQSSINRFIGSICADCDRSDVHNNVLRRKKNIKSLRASKTDLFRVRVTVVHPSYSLKYQIRFNTSINYRAIALNCAFGKYTRKVITRTK